MKRTWWLSVLFPLFGLVANGQKTKPVPSAQANNTLLWRISGKGLQKSSYLFGTMHLLCADDIVLSDSLKTAISKADNVYLELDMNNMFEMLGAMQHMSMKNDTTLADLLTAEEYKKVKNYFQENASMLPFEMLQTYKPLLTASLIAEQQSAACDHMISMEQLVMEEAKSNDVMVKGLETMDFQLGIFDKIPYKIQARQLYQMIVHGNKKEEDSEMQVLTNVYRRQQLEKLEELTKKEDMGMQSFTDLLLYNRNLLWAKKIQTLMQEKSLVVAVGAGHLPGGKGVINLLRQAGYKVEPVNNEMIRKKVKEI